MWHPLTKGLIGMVLAAAAFGCGDRAGPVRLETDRDSYVQAEGGPPEVAVVAVINPGEESIGITMCDLPGLDYDAAPLVLQRRTGAETWENVPATGFCPSSEGAYGVTIEGRVTTGVGQVTLDHESGEYRFVLEYEKGDGTFELATSNEFTTTIPVE